LLLLLLLLLLLRFGAPQNIQGPSTRHLPNIFANERSSAAMWG
jgi:hypothetical protein